jgi:hypothetical protein
LAPINASNASGSSAIGVRSGAVLALELAMMVEAGYKAPQLLNGV